MARILIVEDVKFISKMLAEIFEAEGHEVLVAVDGHRAIKTAREEGPDLILTDIAMPGIDGLEVTRTLKSGSATRHIPIMIVSSRNDKNTVTAAYTAGVDDYVVKPFDTQLLLEKAANLLGGFRMNFSIDVDREIPVVTVLHSELVGEIVEQLPQALEMARGGGSRPLVLEMTRVNKVAPEVADTLIEFEKSLREAGGSLEIVRPLKGLGIRSLGARIEPHTRMHDDRNAAIAAARSAFQQTEKRRVPKEPEPADHGVEATTHGTGLVIKIHRKNLGDEVFEVISEAVRKSSAEVLLELRGVTEVTRADAWELAVLAANLKNAGRDFRILDPEQDAMQILRSKGLGGALFRTKKSEAQKSSSSISSPTTSSPTTSSS
jgi:CheY-like chemotaxis protein